MNKINQIGSTLASPFIKLFNKIKRLMIFLFSKEERKKMKIEALKRKAAEENGDIG